MRRKISDEAPQKANPPARTLEGRENELISLAYDLAEKQLRNGSASSQVITQFLKLGSVRAQLELEKLRNETGLLQAKTSALESARVTEELYANAIAAMKRYGGASLSDHSTDDTYR